MATRRINLFGGPGSGKSSTALDVCRNFKRISAINPHIQNVELVQEYVKGWAYERRTPQSFDQIYIFAKQMRREDVLLRFDEVDVTVTDSPIFLSYCYGKKYEVPGYEALLPIIDKFEEKYPSLNIFIDRGNKAYVQKGRYQTEAEARELDSFILANLENYKGRNSFHVVKHDDIDLVMTIIMNALRPQGIS